MPYHEEAAGSTVDAQSNGLLYFPEKSKKIEAVIELSRSSRV
jgi:hypothetical protein